MLNDTTATELDHLSPLAQSFLDRAFVLGILDTDHLKDSQADRGQRDQALAQLVEADLLSPLKLDGQYCCRPDRSTAADVCLDG